MSGTTSFSSLKDFKQRGKSLREPRAPPPPGGYKSAGWSGSNTNRGYGDEPVSASTGYIPPVSSHSPAHSGPSTPSESGERKGWFNRSSSTDVHSTKPQQSGGGGWLGRSSSPAQSQPGRTASPAQSSGVRSSNLPSHARESSGSKHIPNGTTHEKEKSSGWGLPFGHKEEKKEPRMGRGGHVQRYVPPSEREAGEQFTGRPMRNHSHQYTEEEIDENVPGGVKKPQTWAEWSNEQVKWARETANETGVAAQKQWQTATSGDTRDKVSLLVSSSELSTIADDQVLTGVGNGVTKAAGTAIKYTGKGIWAIGKAATR